MHTKAGSTIPNKTTQARAFHSPLITLLTDQMQAHSPAVAQGSAIRALKVTSDDLARAREKLQAHGLELTPKKDTGRPSYGVVHLKEKKQWRKGRAIISYFQSLSGNLLRITSRALDIILQHLLPQHPGQLSIPQLWSHFHCYLTDTPPDIPLHATNDDLVGFFNSVPQHRLIDAVHSLIQQWQRQNYTHTLTVDTKATGNPFHHSHIGRHHRRHHPHCRHYNHCGICT